MIDAPLDANRPTVLCLGGHDPVGGAGVTADIQTLTALGVHAATAITCLTEQDTQNVRGVHPVSPALLMAQARAVLSDMPVAAIKIGLIGDAELAEAIADLLADNREVPVVLDPVLAAGGGGAEADTALLEAIRTRLLPHARLVTPNLPEARQLTGAHRPGECGAALLAAGATAVLLTGTDVMESGEAVINRRFAPGAPERSWRWPRLAASYHGSGCTLASACAALLSRGLALDDALQQAQTYTYASLQAGWSPGRGQHLPWRGPR